MGGEEERGWEVRKRGEGEEVEGKGSDTRSSLTSR